MDSADAAVSPPCVARPLQLAAFRAVMLAPPRVGDPASLRTFARPYRDVSRRLVDWIERGQALEDETAAVYVHEYTAEGITVRGLVGALSVRDRTEDLEQRAVWPHEAVHRDQAAELASRMAEMGLNPAPILLAHAGTPELRAWTARVTAVPAEWDFTDRAGQHHRIWAVRSTEAVEALNAHLAGGRCLLADGHHRYAAYLALQEEHPGTDWDHGLAMLVDQNDTPLFVGAIHRVLRDADLVALEQQAILLGAAASWTDRSGALERMGPNTLLLTDGNAWLVLTPVDGPPSGVVGWLHDTLLPAVGVSVRSQHHDLQGAVSQATPRTPAVILPTPDFSVLMDLVRGGRLLPEKATSFQPKPNVGVMMRRVHT